MTYSAVRALLSVTAEAAGSSPVAPASAQSEPGRVSIIQRCRLGKATRQIQELLSG